MADTFGLKIGVEGEKEFKKALSDINQSFKVLGSEMTLITSQFDKNDKSIQSLTSRNEVLNKEIDAQKGKIDTLRAALANAAESFGENDKRTQNWQIQLNKAEAELNNMEREVADNTKAIDELGNEEEDGSKKTKQLGDAMDDTGKKTSVFGDVLKATLTADAIKAGLSAIANGIKQIAQAAVSMGKEVVSSFAEYEQLVGGVETMFKGASSAVQGYAENAYKTAGLSANEYMETVTGFSASLIQSLGGDTEKAAQVADMAITDMADNANKFGSDMASIQNAYQGFAKQNYTMLDNLKLGYGGTKQEMERLLADAEKFSGIKYDISSYADVAEAIHVIQTEMGVTGTTAKEASETISGSLSSTRSAIDNLMVGLGNADADVGKLMTNVIDSFESVLQNILPVVENIVKVLPDAFESVIASIGTMLPTVLTAVMDIFTQIMDTLVSLLPELLPVAVEALMTIVSGIIDNLPALLDAALQIIVALVQGIGEALPQLIPATLDAIMTIVQGLLDNLPMLLEAALQLIVGFAQGLIEAIPKIIARLPEIIKAIVDFVIKAIPQIIDAGIKLLVSLVQALPTIITAIVEAIPKIIDNIISAVIGSIPLIIDAGIKLLVSLIQNLPTIITTVVAAIPQIVSSLVDAIVGNIDQIIQAGVQLFVALIENLPAIIVEIVNEVPQIITGIVDAIGSLTWKLVEAGANLIKGLWQGIQNVKDWIWGQIKGFCSGIVDSIKGFFGIRSPSTLFAGMGVNMAEGLGVGFEGEMEKVSQEMRDAIPHSFNTNVDVNGSATGAAARTTQYITIQSPKALSEKEAAREFRNLSRKLALGV